MVPGRVPWWRLGVSGVLLCGCVWKVFGGGPDTAAYGGAPVAGGKVAGLMMPVGEAPAMYDAHPLFLASRRPWVAAASPVAAVARPASLALLAAPRVKLAGTIAGVAQGAAILVREDGGKAELVHVGDRVDGWVVASVVLNSVVLRAGGQETRLFIQPAGGR